MNDVMKVNEMLREEGFQIGDVLDWGENSRLFILFKPVEDEEDWAPGEGEDS